MSPWRRTAFFWPDTIATTFPAAKMIFLKIKILLQKRLLDNGTTMKTVLLTSNNLRHKYVAHSLAENLDLALVIAEKKSPQITSTEAYGKEDAAFISQHFKLRENTEENYFGAYGEFPSKPELLQVNHGEINSPKVLAAMEKVRAQIIVLFGTSIIKEQLLEKYPNRIINLHLGLSPYYRGSATNLFPYYYKEPECVGGTVHVATAAVDKGDILHQFRPDIEPGDDLHDIGNRTILKGGEILPEVLKKYFSGNLIPREQKGSGRFCRNKDLRPEVLREIYRNFKEGLIENYLENKERRDKTKPIVTNYTD
jgi:folate-dependent phosphoribosylglycinamide formyltransferase PurN